MLENNSEDTLILPPSRRRRLRKERGGFSFGFVNSRARLVSPDTGHGYIDHETGRILPGHLSGLALLLVAGGLYLAGRYFFRPNHLSFGAQLPPAVYLLFLLSAATFFLSAAAFWLDRYRVPLLLLLAAWLGVSALFRDGDHRFGLSMTHVRNGWFSRLTGSDEQPMPLPSAPSIADALARADAYSIRRGGAQAGNGPVIAVAAGGGGVYQSAWAARVLAGLTELWPATFAQHLRLISATSGGAVGVMHFVNGYTSDGLLQDREPLKAFVDAAASAATGDIWWGLTYFDFPRILPLRLQRDRGWALEQAWQRTLDTERGQRTIGQWQNGVAEGWRPATAFNAMAVETGQRVVLATYALPPATSARSLATLTNDRDIDIVTAARLSASFPFVTPFARSAGEGSSHLHLADGGYWDNHGVLSMLEWLDAAQSTLDDRHVIVIKIPPPVAVDQKAKDQPWAWQLSAPLLGLETMRTNAQKARNERDLEGYHRERAARQEKALAAERKRLVAVDFPSGGEESLSWHLSRRERCKIEAQWREYGSRSELKYLEPILGPRQPMPPMPDDCRP